LHFCCSARGFESSRWYFYSSGGNPISSSAVEITIVYVVAVVGVLIASLLVSTTDAHEDYFRADRAWFYVVLLTIGYMVSRGLAKSGSRHHDDA